MRFTIKNMKTQEKFDCTSVDSDSKVNATETKVTDSAIASENKSKDFRRVLPRRNIVKDAEEKEEEKSEEETKAVEEKVEEKATADAEKEESKEELPFTKAEIKTLQDLISKYDDIVKMLEGKEEKSEKDDEEDDDENEDDANLDENSDESVLLENDASLEEIDENSDDQDLDATEEDVDEANDGIEDDDVVTDEDIDYANITDSSTSIEKKKVSDSVENHEEEVNDFFQNYYRNLLNK